MQPVTRLQVCYLKCGANVKTVCELLGHGDTRTTYNTYIHIIKEQKHKTVSLLDNV